MQRCELDWLSHWTGCKVEWLPTSPSKAHNLSHQEETEGGCVSHQPLKRLNLSDEVSERGVQRV